MGKRRGRRVREAWLGVGLLLCGGGCFGKPSGSGDGPPEDLELYSVPLGVNTTCREGMTTDVPLDSDGTMGFSAASILAFAEGKKTQRRIVPAGPDADDPTLLVVEVESLAQGARVFEPPQEIIGHGLRCDPWLEMAVRVTVKTSDGALDARFDATLFATHADVAILYARPDGLDLQLSLSPHGVSARLWEDATPEFGDGDPTQRYAAPDCSPDTDADFSLPLDAKHHGVTPQELVDRMQSAAALDLLWDDGTRTAATALFQATTEHGCLAVSGWVPGSTTLSVEAQLDLATDDGRFAAVLPGAITASSDPTHPPDGPYFWVDPEAFAAGEPAGMGFTAYADRTDRDLELWCSVQLDAAEQVTGDLVLSERPADFCVPSETDGAVPCSGELITLESGTLVSR